MVTELFSVGNMQLLGPLISLLLETSPYCQSPWKYKPMLSATLTYALVAYAMILAPLVLLWNPLQLFNFPQSFRWLLGAQTVVSTVAYAVTIRLTRRILACYEHRRLQPSSYRPQPNQP